MVEKKTLKDKSSFELLTEIKNILAAFPNSTLLKEAEVLVEELYSRVPPAVIDKYLREGETAEDLNRRVFKVVGIGKDGVQLKCFRGYTPKTEACVDCQSRSICELI